MAQIARVDTALELALELKYHVFFILGCLQLLSRKVKKQKTEIYSNYTWNMVTVPPLPPPPTKNENRCQEQPRK